jgi:ABC-type multidrug transport system ATPase subunit/predicted component of type VI protein secretion system/ABC-type multidrug transport system permease subunit
LAAARVELVIRGPAGQVQRSPLPESTLLIGREPSCPLCLADPTVSRQHARIERRGEDLLLTDLGSGNGTRLNGTPLPPWTPTPLRPGDTITIGGYQLELVAPAAPPPAPTTPLPQAARLEALARSSGTLPSEERPSREQTAIGVPTQPPRLIVWERGRTREYPIPSAGLRIGRDPSNSVVLDDPQVSRRHAEVRPVPGGFELVDLGSTYGVFQNGQRITRTLLAEHVTYQLSDSVQLAFRAGVALPPSAAPATIQIEFGSRDVLTIGRDTSNSIPLPHPLVSRFHARLVRRQGQIQIEDLGSTNGTFVNGRPVQLAILRETDRIQIGPYEFTIREGVVAAVSTEGNIRVDAVNISRTVRGGKVILQPVSLSFKPRELVAIVGASGSGKTTLLNALSGFRPATAGRVFYNGQDLYHHFELFRTAIGFVPQDDIIHRDLPVIATLRYAAKLRLPRDTSATEREERILEVLRDLGLEEQRDTRVEELSGGQRKRVSMGVELLTKPSLFFLDEPTSGLDPATETRMMRLLRQLADQGRTILLITHATQNITLCDKVCFLGRGGYLAFFGTPNEALDFFGVESFAEIYELMQAEETPGTIARRYASSRYREEHLGAVSREVQAVQSTPPPRPSAKKSISSFRQFVILTARTLAVTRANRKALAILLLQAPIIALLVAIVFPRSIFNDRPVYVPPEKVFAAGLARGPNDPLPNCGLTNDQVNALPAILRDPSMTTGCGNAMRVMSLLFFLVLVVIWFGTSNASKEIVKELPIYKRERMVGVRLLPYLFAKLLPLFGIAVVQNLMFLAIVMAIIPFPFRGPGMVAAFAGLLALTSLAAIALGLLVSSLVSSVDESNSIVPILLIPQVVFSGAVIPLAKMPELTRPVSALILSRWSWEAVGAVLGVPQLAERQGGFSYQMLVEQQWLDAFQVSVPQHTLIVLGFCLVFLVAAAFALKQKDTV